MEYVKVVDLLGACTSVWLIRQRRRTMSMISDLADRLKVESKSMGKYGVDYMATLLMQASDTIIMLSEKARADRPQGEWIYTNDPLRLDDEWACSRCGNISFMRTNFCDRCGARMKGVDDE